MSFRLRDRSFEVAEATLSASLADPYWCDTFNEGQGRGLLWALKVTCHPRDFDGETWSPVVYHESLRLEAPRWPDLDGKHFNWSSPVDPNTGDVAGGFYVFEHREILKADLAFPGRRGEVFGLRWSGRCNVGHGRYGDNLPFAIEAKVTFTGITVRGNQDDDAPHLRSRLSEVIDVDDLVAGELVRDGIYESGVEMRHCHFSPRV